MNHLQSQLGSQNAAVGMVGASQMAQKPVKELHVNVEEVTGLVTVKLIAQGGES